jgi:NADPH:quinone reductase-like Zn-dependent oxidoreductase
MTTNITNTMQAMVIHNYGNPDVLVPAQLPIPSPAAGQVLVKVKAASVNPVDFKWRKKGPFTAFPVVLGWDIAGTVEALGPGVSDFQLGDQVFGMVGFPGLGQAYAEYAVAAVGDIAQMPASLDHGQAAAMALAALTAHQAFEQMALTAGQTVLIHAGAGGVGHFAVQLAKARGATVIATASERNREFVLGLGADRVVDYRQQPFESQIEPVDAVFDCVGGETLNRSFAVVKPGGWLVTIVGKPSGELAAQHGIQAAQILVHPSKANLEMLAALVEAGQLRPHISQRFGLAAVAEAHQALESGRTVGKIVLEVG